MKILKSTKVFRGTSGKVLTVRPDVYIEPLPDVFMLQINALQGQTFTLPTPSLAVTWDTDTYMELYASKYGVLIQADDNSGYSYQAQIQLSLPANTEYYIKIKNGAGGGSSYLPHGHFGIQVTGGNGTGVATPEEGVTVLPLGNILQNQYLPIDSTGLWYKFKTDLATWYTFKTIRATKYGDYAYTVDDWGDGTSSPLITTYNSPDRSHTYQTNGSFVIRITGTMPAFAVNNDNAIRVYITKCLSYGNVGLKRIDFYGCTALTNLPQQTGKLSGVLPPFYFINFCSGCTSLTEIPYGTFLSSNGTPLYEVRSFQSAFYNCTAIRTINSLIFRDVPNVVDFSYTFRICSKLTTLPSQLFKNCYRITAMDYCFEQCSALNNLPADLFYRSMQDINYSLIAKTSMQCMFASCSSLTSIPSGFLSSPQLDNLGVNLVKVGTSAAMFFACSSLASVPAYVFHNQVQLTIAQGTFALCGALTYVPEGAFEGCTALQDAGSYYSNGYRGCFAYCNITSISPTCFKECAAIISFAYTFSNNPNLVNIPVNVFADAINNASFQGTLSSTKINSVNNDLFKYNTKVTTFGDCFANCYSLVTLGEEIFRYNVEASIFSTTFQSCTLLKVLPPKLFRWNTKATNFTNCLYGAKIEKIPVITEDNVDYGFFHFNPLVTTFSGTFSNSNLFNSYAPFVPAIPELTFSNNLQVTDFTSVFNTNVNLESTVAYPLPANLFLYNTAATLFANVFNGCTHANFNYIPPGFFAGNANASDFQYAFYNVKLNSIPATLFSNCPRVTIFAYCFYGSKLTTVPAGLFDTPGTSVTNFSYVFQLSSLLDTLPANLFKFNINVTTFASAFANSGLSIITDADMFRYNVLVTSFANTFSSCVNLKSVPNLLFKYNTAVNNFSGVFQACLKLLLTRNIFYADNEKTTKFLSRNINFTSAFNRTSFTGPNFFSDTLSGAKYWDGVSVNSANNDVYGCVGSSGDIWKQTGGTGAWVALGQTARNWTAVSVNKTNGDVYACVNNGDIYKQTGGVGNFIALSVGNKIWTDICVDYTNNNVYACVGTSGDIWKQTGGQGAFVALGAGARSWNGLKVNPLTGDVYACVSSGDIYKQTAGSGSFVALGQTARVWSGIAIDNVTRDVYASVNNGDVYKQTAGAGTFVALGQTARAYYRMDMHQVTKALYATTWGTSIFYRVEGSKGEAPDLWACTFSFTPTSTTCFATAVGNNAYILSNFASIPVAWK